MQISIFDLFSIGIGPSSSHTVGPMKACRKFILEMVNAGTLLTVNRVNVELFGSLAHTGKGHNTDKACLLGLEGYAPDTVDPRLIDKRFAEIHQSNMLQLNQTQAITFNYEQHLIFHLNNLLPHHTNGLRLSAFDADGKLILVKVYYSVGGGFVVEEREIKTPEIRPEPPHAFTSANELLAICEKEQKSIYTIMLENELTWHTQKEIEDRLDLIIDTMETCIKTSCLASGHLPGELHVKRRAPELYSELQRRGKPNSHESSNSINWLNLYAIAVNEANAAGERIVTAPTNGAAGIMPALLNYYHRFYPNVTRDKLHVFLVTAAAFGIICKMGASISGAEVGCQGEVGTACSMAAAGLTAVLDGTPMQIENAAEIAMEHHLGMTCDPVAGLVQIPCIERNAMGAVKAVNAARLALLGDGTHYISFDKVIATMKQTGKDMMTIYKETSQGGLAVNLPEC